MKTTLKPDHLQNASSGGFYVMKEGNSCWLGYKNDETGDIHLSRISNEFYHDFLREAHKQAHKYKKKDK